MRGQEEGKGLLGNPWDTMRGRGKILSKKHVVERDCKKKEVVANQSIP